MKNDSLEDVAVVIPFYQKEFGTLSRSIQSIVAQNYQGQISIVVVDDGSPVSAKEELHDITLPKNMSLDIIMRQNGGAGAARNAGLNSLDENIQYVAFLDSDDEWKSGHLENAIAALHKGFDFYFSDYLYCDSKDATVFTKRNTIEFTEKERIDKQRNIYKFNQTAIQHIVSKGNVIGTSNVVYCYHKFKNIRFREEFYNGQDFFFWMDLGVAGAQFVLSTNLECDCGGGINIYSGSGWGTNNFLQRTKNELKIWISVKTIYKLSDEEDNNNNIKIKKLRESFARGVVYRLVRFLPINIKTIYEACKISPLLLIQFPFFLVSILIGKIK